MRYAGRLDSIRRVQLRQDVADMHIDRPPAEEELIRDLAISAARRHQLQDRELARCQSARRLRSASIRRRAIGIDSRPASERFDLPQQNGSSERRGCGMRGAQPALRARPVVPGGEAPLGGSPVRVRGLEGHTKCGPLVRSVLPQLGVRRSLEPGELGPAGGVMGEDLWRRRCIPRLEKLTRQQRLEQFGRDLVCGKRAVRIAGRSCSLGDIGLGA